MKSPKKRLTQNWLTLIFSIFAAYWVLDSLVYFINPYSGRVSSLACDLDSLGQSICSITLYGVRGKVQYQFKAEEFQKAIRISNPHSTSDTWACGVSIITDNGPLNFVLHTQKCHIQEELAQRINQSFNTGAYKPQFRITHIGFSPSFIRRGIILLGGWLLLTAMARFGFRLPIPRPMLVGRPAFWSFTWAWARSNFLVKVFFYLAIAFVLAIWNPNYPGAAADLITGNYQIAQQCPACAAFPIINLLCLYPLLAILVIQAIVQRQFLLDLKITVPYWWVTATLVASLPLLIIYPNLSGGDCQQLKYLLIGLIPDWGAPIGYALVAYFLVIGCIQWLLLRRQIPRSFAWLLMPLINAMLLLGACYAIYYWDYYYTPAGGAMKLYLILYLGALVASEIVPAMCMSWLVRTKIEAATNQPNPS